MHSEPTPSRHSLSFDFSNSKNLPYWARFNNLEDAVRTLARNINTLRTDCTDLQTHHTARAAVDDMVHERWMEVTAQYDAMQVTLQECQHAQRRHEALFDAELASRAGWSMQVREEVRAIRTECAAEGSRLAQERRAQWW